MEEVIIAALASWLYVTMGFGYRNILSATKHHMADPNFFEAAMISLLWPVLLVLSAFMKSEDWQ